MDLTQQLMHLVTAYDRQQLAAHRKNPKRYYNYYALGQYMKAVDRVHEEADIKTVFTGALLTYIQKRIKL